MFKSILGFIGPEGSGKSLGMAWFALRHRAQHGTVRSFPGYFIQSPEGERWSEEIDATDWLFIKNLPPDTLICIDEIPVFFDSMLFGTTTARLFGYSAAQRRKVGMGIIYTAQDWSWVHPRIRGATHAIVTCRDQYWDPSQRAEGRKRGEFVNLQFWDIKGFYTGQPWSPGPMFTLFAHHLWPYYDTYGVVDASEGMLQVKSKKQTIMYDASHVGGGEGPHIYRPGEYEDDALPPPVDMTGEPSKDSELLFDLARQGGASALQLSKLQKGLARGSS